MFFMYQLSIVGVSTAALVLGIGNFARAFTIHNPTNGHEYFLTTIDTWEGTQAQAVAAGGNLVTINNAEEQAWLISTFGSNFPFWIGLNDIQKEGQFEWASGQPITYTNWLPTEPDNFPHIPEGEDFVQMFGEAGYWADTTTLLLNSPPNFSHGIVEIETQTSPESIPEPASILGILTFGALSSSRPLKRKR